MKHQGCYLTKCHHSQYHIQWNKFYPIIESLNIQKYFPQYIDYHHERLDYDNGDLGCIKFIESHECTTVVIIMKDKRYRVDTIVDGDYINSELKIIDDPIKSIYDITKWILSNKIVDEIFCIKFYDRVIINTKLNI